jgi:aminoglycoside phosphotransferase (APT) family kinase protein
MSHARSNWKWKKMSASKSIRSPLPTKPAARDLKAVRTTLQAWLQKTLGDDRLLVTDVRLPQGTGLANETLIVDVAQSPGDSSGFVIRVDSTEHLSLGMDLETYYRMNEILGRESDVPVPRVIAFEVDRSILGQRFFLMERVEGLVPPDDPPFHHGGWVTELPVEDRTKLWYNTVEVMVRLHRVKPDKFPFLWRPELGSTGLEQEFRHWIRYSQWCGSEVHPIIAAAKEWLVEHFPDERPTSLSWGDARMPNVMFDGTEVRAIFDWDMVSLAGPEMDLAWWLIMDHQKTISRGLPRLDGIGSPQETVDLWEKLVGRKAQNLHWYTVFNAYRLGSIFIRFAGIHRSQGTLRPEKEAFFANNTGIQWLSGLLDLPPAGPLTTPWVGWDK